MTEQQENNKKNFIDEFGNMYVKGFKFILNSAALLTTIDGLNNLYKGITTGNHAHYQWATVELAYTAWRIASSYFDKKDSEFYRTFSNRIQESASRVESEIREIRESRNNAEKLRLEIVIRLENKVRNTKKELSESFSSLHQTLERKIRESHAPRFKGRIKLGEENDTYKLNFGKTNYRSDLKNYIGGIHEIQVC